MLDFKPFHEFINPSFYYMDHDNMWTNSVKRSDDYAPYKISKFI